MANKSLNLNGVKKVEIIFTGINGQASQEVKPSWNRIVESLIHIQSMGGEIINIVLKVQGGFYRYLKVTKKLLRQLISQFGIRKVRRAFEYWGAEDRLLKPIHYNPQKSEVLVSPQADDGYMAHEENIFAERNAVFV